MERTHDVTMPKRNPGDDSVAVSQWHEETMGMTSMYVHEDLEATVG